MVFYKKLPYKYKSLLMAFTWANPYPDLLTVCRAFGLYELADPIRFSYTPVQGFIQDGPQCGLVALAMCMGECTKEKINELYEYAKECKYSNNGEMFSTDYMKTMAEELLENHVEIYEGPLDSEEILNFLLDKGMLLVPYDCDRNHTPCAEMGHKAHWAAITGVIDTDTGVFVIAKHGKSLNTAIWDLRELSESNRQLVEFSPDRKKSDLIYVLPEGGIAGPKGLCNRSVLIHPLNKC